MFDENRDVDSFLALYRIGFGKSISKVYLNHLINEEKRQGNIMSLIWHRCILNVFAPKKDMVHATIKLTS